MYRPICYFQLLHLLRKVSNGIKSDLPLSETLDYYCTFVPTIPQRMTQKPDLKDSLLYIPPVLSIKDD